MHRKGKVKPTFPSPGWRPDSPLPASSGGRIISHLTLDHYARAGFELPPAARPCPACTRPSLHQPPAGVASNRACHQPCSGHVASRGSTKQATLIVVRGCHVILTLRASPANRASEDLTLQVANAMASLAALRFRGPCGTADQREGMAGAVPLERRAVYTRVLGAAADCGEIHPVNATFRALSETAL